MKIGGTLGKVTEKIKKNPVVQTATDIYFPGAGNAIDAATGKKSVGEAIVDTTQDWWFPGTRRNIGSASGSEGPAGTPQSAPYYDPSLNARNQWQGMRNKAIDSYRGANLGYNPYMTQTGPQMKGMNYDPYRSAAVNQGQSQAANQFASQQGQLLSGSDRMKAFSDFNRQKIMGTLGANAQYDQAQSQNQLDVGRYNAGRAFDVQKANVMAQNQANQDLAQANSRRDLNLYNEALNQRNLGRQLEASSIISKAQQRGVDPTGIQKILNPVFDWADGAAERWKI